MTPHPDPLSSALSLARHVRPFGGWGEAGRYAGYQLSASGTTVRRNCERMLVIYDATGEARRSARATWSDIDEIRRERAQ